MNAPKRGASASILYRDAARASRRWQTYALRMGFSAALLAMVLATIWAIPRVPQLSDPSDLGRIGRGMFVAFAVVQVLLATLIAPFATSQAIIEEREDATMDLLALTYLSPGQILGAKVTSRVLTLLTVILGALPVLGMVVSLGGVSVVEVIAVTSHAMLTVVLLGMLGAFFALFTRSPVLATLASVGYAATAYLVMPLVYGLLVLDWRAFAQFSPLMGTTAQNWWALLPILSYMPVVILTFVLGARLFALRIARARLMAYFDRSMWGVWPIAILWGIVGLLLIIVVPPAVGGAAFAMADANATTPVLPWYGRFAVMGVSRTVLWVWCVLLLIGGTWLYLRVGMDMVMMGDDLLAGRSSRRDRVKRGKDVRVWGNPVLWRAIRPSAWKIILPAVTMWFLVLLGVFQTGLWIIPGGLLTIGGLNAAAALVLTLWLAAGAIDAERRAGTLQILLTTTLSTWRVVFGKFMGIAAPSFPLLAISYPLILLGVPHLQLVLDANSLPMSMVVGALACVWITAVWLLTIALTMFLAMRLRNPRAAQPLALGFMGSALFFPPVVAMVLTPYPWLGVPFRLMVPVLVSRPTWWETSLSTLAWGSIAVVLLLWMAARLRRWGST